ncbi:uncharacterized protein PHACADRAFT_189255, partial [Phanerochaete carnosa HHB-10118-sp]
MTKAGPPLASTFRLVFVLCVVSGRLLKHLPQEQFPLVQRQWEAVSQFRSQITHKATLSLREPNLTSSEVCAILLALHLLESRPFAETLNTFLSQRSRCLTNTLSRHKDRMPNGNGGIPELSLPHMGTMKARIPGAELRDVRQRLKAVLEVISRTLGSSRIIFLGEANEPPLMRRVIAHIQTSMPSSSDNLPPEVRLTSQTLLSGLPSSNHFLLLPATIKGYKPYLDAESLSPEKQARFSNSLADWFGGALQSTRTAMCSWFATLTTVRELWETRTWCRKLIRASSGLHAEEKTVVNGAIDAICRARAVEIWKSVLTSTDAAFHEHLDSGLAELGKPSGGDVLDAQPVRYLLQAPPISLSSSHSGKSASASFRQYSNSLEQQISGRTPLLQDVLDTIETRIQALQHDLDTMRGRDEDTQCVWYPMAYFVLLTYVLHKAASCTAGGALSLAASTLRPMVFLARLGDELSSSVGPLTRVGCSASATDNFRERLRKLHEDIMQQWQTYVVDKTLDDYQSHHLSSKVDSQVADASGYDSLRPSAAAVNSVLDLATSLQQFGGLLDPMYSNTRAQQLLEAFSAKFAERFQECLEGSETANVDMTKDL